MRTKLAAITLAALALLAFSARDVVAGEDGRRSGRGKGKSEESRRSDDGRRDRDRADSGRVIVVERDDHRSGREEARGSDNGRRHGQEQARGRDNGRRHSQERARGHSHGNRRVITVAKHRRPMPRPSRSAYRAHGHRHGHRACRYVEGRFVFEMRQIFIPGVWREERVAPVYREHRGRFGIVIRILIKPGYTHRTFEPGHYENRNVRVWVPGHWVCHR